MINSYEKEKFEVGKEYFTYYWERTNRGNRIKDYTGVMKVKLLSNDKSEYSPNGYLRFEILESKPLGNTIAHNILTYMNGYGCASCDFYDNEAECTLAHDKSIIDFSKGQNTKDRDTLLKKLIFKHEPNVPKIESDSIEWYNSLTKRQKEFVSWIKHYYEKI